MTQSLTAHPGGDSLDTKAAHELKTSTAHGEITDQVPEEGNQLEDGSNQGQQTVLELQGRKVLAFVIKQRKKKAREIMKGKVNKVGRKWFCLNGSGGHAAHARLPTWVGHEKVTGF
jgi:hypothetical protein